MHSVVVMGVSGCGKIFNPTLVDDQFATLESPEGESGVLTVDATEPIADLCRQAVEWMNEAD